METDSEETYLRLHELQRIYQNKLAEYKTAYSSYISLLQENENASQYNVVPNMLFLGTTIAEISTSTIEECESSCSSNLECSGASYLSLTDASGECILMKGGQITNLNSGMPSNGSWSAIENKIAKALTQLDGMNNALIDLNNEIIQIYKNNNFMSWDMKELNATSLILEDNYRKLLEEREKIASTLQVYKSADRQFSEEYITVEQSSYQFYLWMVIAILAAILAVKMYVF